MTDLTICYLPSQWRSLDKDHLRASACAVIDVIRATTTLVTALAAGAQSVQAVASLEEARALKLAHPDALLAGERGGVPLPGFDLGNSPREMTAERVKNRRIIQTTTNGTQALAACREGRAVLTASFLNLEAAAAKLRELGPPWIIACAGFEGAFGLDDAIVAGALAEALGQEHPMAALYRSVQKDLEETLLASQAGQEMSKLGMEGDVSVCAQRDRLNLVPMLKADGTLRL